MKELVEKEGEERGGREREGKVPELHYFYD